MYFKYKAKPDLVWGRATEIFDIYIFITRRRMNVSNV